MNSRPKISLCLRLAATFACAALLTCIQTALADGPGLDIQSTVGGQELNNGSFSLGWTFSVASPITVSALGFYDAGQNGLSASHDVGIFDESCSLVANATVEPSDALNGFFRYHPLASSITLSPGQTYRIAAVTGSEPYLYNPTSVVLDPAVVFDKFTAWHGALQQTNTLQCPDFPSSTQFYGDFGPTFYIGDSFDNPNDPNKRDTSIKLFCNRSGDLSTANCTATVGDAGAPPRTTPTGTVEFSASEGTLAGTACQLEGVSLSPGIASCSITYFPPAGFAIGTAFPVTATYGGDSAFNPSSTSHELIKASCVGTTEKPCPNSVGLEFDRLQAILDKVITLNVTCGSGDQTQSSLALPLGAIDGPPPAGACTTVVSLGLDVEQLLMEATQMDLQAISDAYSQRPKSFRDAVFEYAKSASSLDVQYYLQLQGIEAAELEIFKVIEKDLLSKNWANIYQKYLGPGFFAPAKKASKQGTSAKKKKKKKQSLVKFATATKTIAPDTTATIKLKLNKRMQKFVAVMRDAGFSTIPLKATMSVKQKKRVGKATLEQSVDVTLE